MHLSQATNAPLTIAVGDDTIAVPPFTLRDWVAWGDEVDVRRLDAVTARMTDEKRAEWLAVYVLPPTTLPDLRRIAPTPAGVDRICRACLARATVVARRVARDGGPSVAEPVDPPEPLGPDRAAALIDANGPATLELLAARLARMGNDADAARGPAGKAAPAGKGGADPLAGSGTVGSPTSPGTGSSTSPSTQPPTPDATPSTTPSPCSSGS